MYASWAFIGGNVGLEKVLSEDMMSPLGRVNSRKYEKIDR